MAAEESFLPVGRNDLFEPLSSTGRAKKLCVFSGMQISAFACAANFTDTVDIGDYEF